MAEEHPWFWMIAGPNGAGKTTLAEKTLEPRFGISAFHNADDIERNLPEPGSISAQREAGKLFLNAVRQSLDNKESFAIETTLSGGGQGPKRRIMEARDLGYRIGFVYIWIETPERCFERVLDRTQKGKHFIPEIVVHRRFDRSRMNFPIFTALADKILVFENSGARPSLMAIGSNGRIDTFEPAFRSNLTAYFDYLS